MNIGHKQKNKIVNCSCKINVLDQIRVLARNFVKTNKHTALNKHIGIKLLAQKYNFL